MEIVITAPHIHITDAQSISLEEVMKRKAMRRRRVAKRMLHRCPLFAVEEMQGEFPGYTYEEWEADVTRRTRKGKSYRRAKTKAFDWRTIRKEIPDFFYRCITRSKTKATLRGKLKDGSTFTCIVRSAWVGEYGENRLRTHELINLWRGPLKNFIRHPAIIVQEHQNEIK